MILYVDREARVREAFNKLFDKPGVRSDSEHEQMSEWSREVYGEGSSGEMVRMASPIKVQLSKTVIQHHRDARRAIVRKTRAK